MKKLTSVLAGVAATALAASAFAPSATAAPSEGAAFETSASSKAPAGTRVNGLTANGVLVSFALDNPRDVNRVGRVTGLAEGDSSIVGMDVRPSNGRLYAVGDGGGVYILALRTARATQVGQIETGDLIPGGLEGQRFGVDFNPAADALRVVSDSGQNLRITFEGRNVAATFEDTDLTTPPTPGTTTGVTAAAYTNNDNLDVTGTTLLDINTSTNGVFVQAPANNGTLSSVGSLRKGVGPDASFDIYSRVNGSGTTTDNAGYAVLMQNGNRILHRINLTTGAATRVGVFPANNQVTDIAVRLAPNAR